MGIEAWRKNEALDSFDVLKKGELITVEGYFKPEEWTDSKSGEKRNRIVMVATTTVSGKRRLYNRKNNKVHSEKCKRLKRTADLVVKYRHCPKICVNGNRIQL